MLIINGRSVLEDGYDICTVQEMLGYNDVSTIMVYTHVLQRGGKADAALLDPRVKGWPMTSASALP